MRFRLPSLSRRLLPIVCAISLLGTAAAAAADAPRVFWASDPVKPGQTVQLSGMGLAAIETVEVARLDDRPEETAGEVSEQAEILARSDSGLSFVLPRGLTPGVFSVMLRTGDTVSNFQLNAPDIYWAQGDRGTAATPGGWLRISGRNMAMSDKAVVKLIAADGKESSLGAAGLDTWSASFPIPGNMPGGSYRARLWNGTGDASAWRDAGTIEIVPRPQADRPVMELFSDQPDSADHDDTARINTAMQALAAKGGGTLLLHYGIYRLSGPLDIPDGIALKGEANDLVTLIWKDMETPPEALIQGVRDFSIEDLTIYAQRHFHIIKGGFDRASGASSGQNITVRRVIVRATAFLGRVDDHQALERLEAMRKHSAGGVTGLLLTGRDIVVEDCDVLSSMRPFVLVSTKGARVSGNTFHVGRGGWYSIGVADGVLFENNRIIGTDLQASGGGINTLGSYPSSRNVLMRNNRFETLFGWDREAMTTDGPAGYYSGPIVPVSKRTVKIDPAGFGHLKDLNWEGSGLFVIQGRGLGAIARVVGRDGDTVELDRDISGLTDGGSIVTIAPMQENYLIIGNRTEDSGPLQIYGVAYKHVFAENVAVRSYGLIAKALRYQHIQPNFYIQFLGNETISPPLGSVSGIEVTGRQFKENRTFLTFGFVVRGNSLRAGTSIRVNGISGEDPAVRNVLIEQNEISNADTGIDIGWGVEDLVVRDNITRDVRIPVKRPDRQ